MSLEPKIMTRVKAGVPLVSSRVEFVDAPASTPRPYITFAEISPGREYSHQGYSSIRKPVFRFNVWADSYVSAKQTAEELIDTLESWFADGVQGAFLESKVDMKEEDSSFYHTALTFSINYKE